MIARSEMGNFDQRPDLRSCLVMLEVLGIFRDHIMVPSRATDIVIA